MGEKRSASKYKRVKIHELVLLGFVLICTVQFSFADTNPSDVAAINGLYTALGSPPLPGWVSSGGDPCAQGWQGVQCNGSVIQEIILNGANLGGELGESLGSFVSIRAIVLNNNQIGGSIPSSLPVTLQNLFLSDNQLTGSIPPSLSSLPELTDMSLNDNLLTGEIPDSFQSLQKLINLDLSNNNLSGELPPTMENLSALTSVHLQNNKLSGTLDVLQDLPLKDLNVENNQFAGPIPQKLLSIPNFRNDGNLFNTTLAPSLPPRSPGTPSPSGTVVSGVPSSAGRIPTKQADGPTAAKESNSGKSKGRTKRVVWITIASILGAVIVALALLLFVPHCRRREQVDRTSKKHQIGAFGGEAQNPRNYEAMVQPPSQAEKLPKGAAVKPKEKHNADTRKMATTPRPQDDQDVQKMEPLPKLLVDHEIDMSGIDSFSMPSPPLPPPSPPPVAERVIVEPAKFHAEANTNTSNKRPVLPIFAKSFTIASLQQYTNSFSQENLIGLGMLGSVYRAELPNGKILAVKKLDKRVSDHQKDDEFLELVNGIDKIRHANIVELIGYCAEHGQRLLIYEYCSNGSLQDAIHSDDEFGTRLSWNTRIRIALGAARALEYLHEQCQPPIVHRNFKSANILLDDDLSVRISECGLAPLITSGSVSQLSGQLLTAYGYGAPEFESGIYTYQSDVYSFGVVMLELLTGRKSYDRSRPRGEQFLVRWAIPQLHDIDALSRMVDPSLNGEYPAKSLSNFADIISRCVQSEPEFRPAMSEVVLYLLNMIRRESQQSESSEK
ncbi:protein STRUBBELIG-RECEPTOR FAMILY 3 isoform X1 [Arachis hypogaea]|uniref:protein STRUBBELIG-RECEPTOR FAMILY 3 isoform X1 n=2 Tax=Arachis hypogaea TaxID=3818 RepID=UPI000DEE08F1|nr:protein STRUBBELIG-RECEPTOR FAMILY 3 isoform X1 [Arachis hypogaea]XP_025669672.1 protein STRUBBELIG-RECEPTOR FAMILY 3 isoform X1 [Arachis hypogaea]